MFKSILVPIDVAHRSSWRVAIPQSLELARGGRGRMAVMTVVREATAMLEGVRLPFQVEKRVEDARTQLAAIVAEFRGVGIDIEQEVRFGSIGHEILGAARQRDVDLIVMASHRPEMLDYLIGPNAAHVALHASCSVLVLREKEFR
jgi:nucleotide-binding universal stress UspA family protein